MSTPVLLPVRLRPGDRVEVQNRFDGRWASGFEVAAVLGSGPPWRYRLRRCSDGAVLPRPFEEDAVAADAPALPPAPTPPPERTPTPEEAAA